MLKIFRRLLRQKLASAGIEFALVAPILAILLFGVYDLCSVVIDDQKIYAAAHAIAASVSNLSVQQDGSTSLTYQQVQETASEIWAQLPFLRSGKQDGVKSVTISSIVFEQTSTEEYCGTTPYPAPCYTPVVVWSAVYTGGDSHRTFQASTSTTSTITYTPQGSVFSISVPGIIDTAPLRSCTNFATTPVAEPAWPGSLNQTDPTSGASSDLTNLRTLTLGDTGQATAPPSPIIVVDVNLNYLPGIGFLFHKALNFWVSAYWPVRSVKVTAKSNAPLYQQFTTISASSLSGVSNNDYCVNYALTSPGAESQ